MDEQARLATSARAPQRKDWLKLLIEEHGRLRSGKPPSDAAEFRIAPLPFPGLRSFTPQEGGVFFGRSHSVEEVRDRLTDERIVSVLGGSGSGKSSVVRAGLMPHLNASMSISGRTGNWYAAEFRPRTAPMEELAEALAELVATAFPSQAADEALKGPQVDPATLRSSVRNRLLEMFRGGPTEGPERGLYLARTLIGFMVDEFDRRDRALMRGRRAGRPNLLLVIDQFEEVFRPEVEQNGAGMAADLLELLVQLHALLDQETKGSGGTHRPEHSGLFVVLTMRSEELHRCTEYPGLTDVVNHGIYVLDLLDPKADRDHLRRAIVMPVQRVFLDWGLAPDDTESNPDWPYACGTVERLLDAAAEFSNGLGHRPDQLPLLQHALQTMWESAIKRWERHPEEDPLICLDDLPREVVDPVTGSINFSRCLDIRADLAANEAGKAFNARIPGEDGSSRLSAAAMRAIFRALARLDDRGNWARRFATTQEIAAFLKADLQSKATDGATSIPPDEELEAGLLAALTEFRCAGYIAGDGEGAWDISHESLIRNWGSCKTWLRTPLNAMQALAQVAQDLGWSAVGLSGEKLVPLISQARAEALKPVTGDRPVLPVPWTNQQISILLSRKDIAERWTPQGEVTASPPEKVREGIAAALKTVEEERARAEKHAREQVLENIAARNKARRFRIVAVGLAGLAVMAIVAAIAIFALLNNAETAARAAGGQLALNELLVRSNAVAGLRARVPLFVGDMLNDNKVGKTPTHDEMKGILTAGLFSTARAVLGNYEFRKLDSAAATRGPEHCIEVGADSAAASGRFPETLTRRSVRLSAAGEATVLGIETRGSEREPWKPAYGVSFPVAPKAQACLSDDAAILSVASPGEALPQLYQIGWLRGCQKKELDCSEQELQDLAIMTPLQPGAPLPELAAYSKQRNKALISCVRALTSPADAKDPAIATFTVHPSGGSCGSATEAQGLFAADFFPGVQEPLPTRAAVRELVPCNRGTGTGARNQTNRTCTLKNWADTGAAIGRDITVEITYGNDDVSLNLAIRDRGDMFAPTITLRDLPFDAAGLTHDGDLVLHIQEDENAGTRRNPLWRVTVGREALASRLKTRTDLYPVTAGDASPILTMLGFPPPSGGSR